MLKCNKMEVHTFLICIALTFVLKMDTLHCEPEPDDFAGTLFSTADSELVTTSPTSIRNILGVAYFGSNGTTYDEMQNNIHLPRNKEVASHLLFREQRVYTETEVYINKSLELTPEVHSLIADELEAKINLIDFSPRFDAQGAIVDSIKKKAPNLRTPFFQGFTDTYTTAVVVNVVNFAAEFLKPFDKILTINNISMMHLVDTFLYNDIEELNAKAVVLPFKNNSMKMLLLLPTSGSLWDLKSKLKNYHVHAILHQLSLREVNIRLPKFDFSQKMILDGVLKAMNVREAFEKNANFSSMFSGGENSYISILQESSRFVAGPKKVDIQMSSILQLRLTSEYSIRNEGVPFPNAPIYSRLMDSEPDFIVDQHFNSKPSTSQASFFADEPFIAILTTELYIDMAMSTVIPKHANIE